MSRFGIIFLAIIIAGGIPFGGRGQQPLAAKTTQLAAAPGSVQQPSQVKVTIAATTLLLGPPASSFRKGDQIPVTVTMTNLSPAPVSVCVSSDLYQNLPKLTKDGKEIPYSEGQSEERVTAARNRTCEEDNLPSPLLLKPNVPEIADWFVLTDGPTSIGAESWYGTLPPGKYELSIKRRLTCCEGPAIESNRVSFEVLP